jgi:hypothetical protein
MRLNRDETTAAVLDVLQRAPLHVDLLGVSSRGRSNRVEVMVAIEGRGDDHRRRLLNLTRNDRAALMAELQRKLNDELGEITA